MAFLEAVADWSEHDKIKAIIAVGEIGYKFTLGDNEPDRLEVDLYQADSLVDLVAQFVEKARMARFRRPFETT